MQRGQPEHGLDVVRVVLDALLESRLRALLAAGLQVAHTDLTGERRGKEGVGEEKGGEGG